MKRKILMRSKISKKQRNRSPFLAGVIIYAALLLLLGHDSDAEVYYPDAGQLNMSNFGSFLHAGEIPGTGTRIDLFSMLSSYKGHCIGLETKGDGIYLIMKNGKRILYDDKEKKTFEQKLDDPDIKNMLELIYEPGPVMHEPGMNDDPGRFRTDEFFGTVYGGTEKAVKAGCEIVRFCNRDVLFNKNNGASAALKRVGEGLMRLSREDPEILDYVCPTAGTVAFRRIEGTQRKSPHSYGIAIDLSTGKSNYWRWDSKTKEARGKIRKYPVSIINEFEKNGFIWGGKWDHYDTMHFEYRPELIVKYRLTKQAQGSWRADPADKLRSDLVL